MIFPDHVHQGKSWQEWDEEYKQPTKKFKLELFLKYEKEIGYYQFLQYMFFTEWEKVKAYANAHDVEIIGDIPIFVSMDSADVWGNPSLFQLDAKGHPLAVAGVPPDYFSETGQLWGNPLYDWDAHEETKFAWWISRIKNQLKYVDILRIDHFRGFEAYWSVPYDNSSDALQKVCRRDEGKRMRIYPEHLVACIVDDMAGYRHVWCYKTLCQGLFTRA